MRRPREAGDWYYACTINEEIVCMRVLIVDDSYVVRKQLKVLLTECGEFDCDCAANGAIAYDMFRAAHSERIPYELITVDIEMPEVTGHEMVDTVRKWEKENKKRPARIIMVSVKGDPRNVVDAYNKLCDEYVQKPVNVDILKDKLRKVGLLV